VETITEIVDPSFRSGIGKTGKPWTMMKIKTDSGKEASVFAPAQVGDPVQMEFNEQYKNYNAKVVNASKMQAIMEEEKKEEKIDTILDKLDKVLELLGEKSGYEKAKETANSLKPDTFNEEEVDLEDIPF